MARILLETQREGYFTNELFADLPIKHRVSQPRLFPHQANIHAVSIQCIQYIISSLPLEWCFIKEEDASLFRMNYLKDVYGFLRQFQRMVDSSGIPKGMKLVLE